MSVNRNNKDGTLTKVASLGIGKYVPSVSHYQTGTGVISYTSGYATLHVTLPTAMPDTDYVVDVSLNSTDEGPLGFTVSNQTTSGFTISLWSTEDFGEAADIPVKWQAFKLMTDAQAALDEEQITQNASDIADIQKVIPSSARSSNQLVTIDDINGDAFEADSFYKTSKTFSAGSSTVYYNICAYSGQYPFIVRFEGQGVNTTACVQELSGTYYANSFKYSFTKINIPMYASSTAPVSRAEASYLIVDANNDVWVAVASYSRVKVTVLASSKVAIDGNPGTPVQTYKVDGYSESDSKAGSVRQLQVASGSSCTISTDYGIFTSALISISRDSAAYTALGLLTWKYGEGFTVDWLVPLPSGYATTASGTLGLKISNNTANNVVISLLNLGTNKLSLI